ncbi:MAG: PAS domain-containing protein [Gammaproteobacteria bacterium]|jgi:PAS domain S-box-containing protein
MKDSSNKKTIKITLDELVEQLPGHIYWKSKDGLLLGCNKKTWEEFGLSSLEDYIGKTDYDLFPKKQADELTKIDREVLRTGKIVITEELSDVKDGSTALYLSHKAPLKNKDGEIIGISGISLDITKERQTEAKRFYLLENIISLIPGHVYWKDKNGKYLGCNNEQAKALGLSSAKDIINKIPYENLSKKDAQSLRKSDDKVLKNGETITVEEPGVKIDGTMGIFLTKKTPLYDKDENIMGLLGVSFDITERKKQEKELKRAKEQAEEANQLKSDFISNMEHDIRTPLIGIYGMMDIFAKQETDPEKKPLMNEMVICAKELMDFCDGILNFSKIESDSFPIVSKSFALQKLIDSVITIESMAAKNKNLDLSAKFDKKLPKVVISDPYRIKRILLNLVSNAIKFTKKGKVTISVTLNKEETENRRIIAKFVVTDTGMGIPDDKKALIYERFTKVIPSNTGLYKGLGLGLRIVKQFVDELDGDIHLKSEIGKGSMFTLFLPLKIPLSDEIIDDE